MARDAAVADAVVCLVSVFCVVFFFYVASVVFVPSVVFVVSVESVVIFVLTNVLYIYIYFVILFFWNK
jgi:hypothetical protein